jgi:hypothetical protein
VYEGSTPFDVLGTGYQRPMELATLRLFNMVQQGFTAGAAGFHGMHAMCVGLWVCGCWESPHSPQASHFFPGCGNLPRAMTRLGARAISCAALLARWHQQPHPLPTIQIGILPKWAELSPPNEELLVQQGGCGVSRHARHSPQASHFCPGCGNLPRAMTRLGARAISCAALLARWHQPHPLPPRHARTHAKKDRAAGAAGRVGCMLASHARTFLPFRRMRPFLCRCPVWCIRRHRRVRGHRHNVPPRRRGHPEVHGRRMGHIVPGEN